MDKIAVLLPCYNEASTIATVVAEYKKALPEATIYVYDNNSTDGTDKAAAAAGAVVRYETAQGKGCVIRSMFRDIDAECYIMADGDGTYPATKAREMADLVLLEHVDMVVGNRLGSTYFSENKRAFHNSGNVLVKKLVKLFFRGAVPDVMTGSRAFSPLFVKSFPVRCKGFEIETEMTIHALDKGLHIKSVTVDYKDRPAGSVSKLNTFSDGFKVLSTIARLCKNYKPLLFFSIISLILMAVGLAFFIPVFAEYLASGAVPRLPTLLCSIGLWTVAVMCFLSGLVLETVAQNEKRQFEVNLNIIRLQLKALQND